MQGMPDLSQMAIPGMNTEDADPQKDMKQGQGSQNPMGSNPGLKDGSHPNSGVQTQKAEGANGKNQQQQMGQMPGTNPNMMGMGMMGQMQVTFF
jgi:hypothetical protein